MACRRLGEGVEGRVPTRRTKSDEAHTKFVGSGYIYLVLYATLKVRRHEGNEDEIL